MTGQTNQLRFADMWRAVVLPIIPLLLACSGRLPSVEINTLWKSNINYFVPVDLDGDSTDELLVAGGDYVVNRFDQSLRSVGGTQYLHRGILQPEGNLLGGPDSEHLWLTYKRHDSLYLLASAGLTSLVAVGKDSLPPAGWDGNAGGVVVADIDADRRLEAVVSVFSQVDARPRGIYVLDWLTGKLRWKYETGPPVWNLLVRDFDGDGRDELLFGSGAFSNGGIANGTTDESSYVFLLGSDGRARWRTAIGRYSSMAYAAWLNDGVHGTPRVMAWEVGNRTGGRTSDSLFVLDGLTGAIIRRAGFGVFTNCAALVPREGNKPRFVVAGSDRVLRLLDASLRLVREVRTTYGTWRLVAADFSRPQAHELAVVTDDGYLKVMSRNLNPLGETKLDAGGRSLDVTTVRYGGRSRLLVLERVGGKSTWSLLDIVPLPISGLRIPLVQAALAVTLLTFAFGASLLGLRYRQTRDMRVVVRGLTGQAGVVELNKRGRVRHVNRRARNLLGSAELPAGPLLQAVRAALAEPLGSAPKELPVTLGSDKTVLARAARVRSGVMLTLEDISAVEYLQRVKAWAPVAQKLAHGIKNPLGTIMGAVEQIETEVNRRGMKAEGGSKEPKARSADETKAEVRRQNEEGRSAEETDQRVKKYIGYVKDEVTRLKKMTDAFMRFTKLNPPALEPKDVNELVRKVVARYGWDLERLENGDSPTKREDARYSPHFPSRSGTVPVFGGQSPLSRGISLELNLDHKLPSVALDEEGMANVLDIVVENAVEAMMGRSQKLETRSEKLEVPGAERILRIRTAVRSLTTKAPRHEGSDGTSTNNTDARTLEPLDPRTQVSIEVTDTGAGIPEKYLDKVFEPYFTHGKQDGTGLGLALAKKIVEDHRGRMEIHSREGEGTTVAIILPAEKEPG